MGLSHFSIPVMKSLFFALALAGVSLAQEADCKPSIEPDTEGIHYDALLKAFIARKKELKQIQANSEAQSKIDQIMANYGAYGLDSIMEQISSMGLTMN